MGQAGTKVKKSRKLWCNGQNDEVGRRKCGVIEPRKNAPPSALHENSPMMLFEKPLAPSWPPLTGTRVPEGDFPYTNFILKAISPTMKGLPKKISACGGLKGTP